MSIIRLGPHNFENYELVARPHKTFRSSSSGVTGSIVLMKDGSTSLKDLSRKSFGTINQAVALYDDEEGENLVDLHVRATEEGSPGLAENLLTYVNSTTQGLRYSKRQEVLRTIPGTKLNKSFFKKNTVRKILYPFYRNLFPSMEWAYTNYNTLSFYEDTQVPSDSALIYPAGTGSSDKSNFYAPDDAFTFDFYIKPRINSSTIKENSEISPGTILHMSGCFAVSLVTGSSKDPRGISDRYRILLQLSSSANVKPDDCLIQKNSLDVTTNIGTSDFLFTTTNNSIFRDRWNHVAITWPGGQQNNGTGSFYVNGLLDSNFAITASSAMQTTSPALGVDDPNAVFVGNYYKGTNKTNQAVSLFFNNQASKNEGVENLVDSELDPTGFSFTNPLRAELHDIKIFNKHKTVYEIRDHRNKGRSSISSDLIFYVPPFFVKESPKRNVLRTPFVADESISTDDPFNVSLSFGLGSLDINLENFTREFVQKKTPRLWNLTSSALNVSMHEKGKTSNDVIYSRGSARKKLRTILPCDNGLFRPDFALLKSGSEDMSKFIDGDGIQRLDLIGLTNLIEGEDLSTGLTVHQIVGRSIDENGKPQLVAQWENIGAIKYPAGQDSFVNDLVGASPEDPSLSPGSILSVFQRTGDTSSSEIVIFDISNMFYGDSITPGTLVLEDLMPTGSNGSLTFKLRDNGLGNLYRSDLEEGQRAATWASVGNVLYDEGLVVVKSPNLGFFGQEDFRISFKGKKTVYVFEVTIPVEANQHNSSSNPTYEHLRPTDYTNEIAQRFNYITGIRLHDDNLNIVGKASLSQPFMKREDDRVVIKLRMDF